MKTFEVFEGGTLRISLSGELDHHGAKETMHHAADSIENHVPQLCILDFKEVGFMDSSGIAFILNVNKRMGNIDGRLMVENVDKQPMKVIRASGIERIISIKEL